MEHGHTHAKSPRIHVLVAVCSTIRRLAANLFVKVARGLTILIV
jgi:hypothetical protein